MNACVKKSILFITYEEFPSFIGTTTRVRGIARALVRKGHHVEILAPCYSGKSRSEMHSPDSLLVHRIRMPYLFGKFKIPIFSMAVFVFLFALRAKWYLRKYDGQFSFLIAEQIHSYRCANFLKNKFHARIVIDDPDDLSYVIEEKLKHHRMLCRLIKPLALSYEKKAFQNAFSISHSSRAVRKAILNTHGIPENKLCFLSNGIDTAEYPDEPKADFENRLFFNCSLPYYQNLSALENIASLMRFFRERDFHDYKITLVINDISLIPDSIKQELDRCEHLRVLSAVPSLIPYLEESDIVLLPFQKGHRSTAGPRLKTLEALASCKLVLTTPEGIDEIDGCQDNVNIMLCDDTSDMAEKCRQILTNRGDQEGLKTIQRNARKLVLENYTWDSLVSVYDKLFL